MDSSQLHPRSLRNLLYAALPTDSELEAFCNDYFPDTQRLYSNGMDRESKITLLLQREDHDAIAANLRSLRSAVATHHLTPDFVPSTDGVGDSVTPAAKQRGRLPLIMGVAVTTMLVTGSGFWGASRYKARRSASVVPAVVPAVVPPLPPPNSTPPSLERSDNGSTAAPNIELHPLPSPVVQPTEHKPGSTSTGKPGTKNGKRAPKDRNPKEARDHVLDDIN